MLQYQIEVIVGKSLLRATGNGEWPVTRARRGAELQPGSEVTASLVAYSHNCPDTELRAGELGAMQTCRPCLTLFGVSWLTGHNCPNTELGAGSHIDMLAMFEDVLN